MINKKTETGYTTLYKISKHEIHENLKDEIEIRTDFYEIIKDFLDNLDKYFQIHFMYSLEIADVSSYNDSMNNLFKKFHDFYFNNLNKRRDSVEYMKELKAYDFGKTLGGKFNFELKDIVVKDLNDLNREHVGYIYHHIVRDIQKTGIDYDSAFISKNVTKKFMRDMLLTNKVLNLKYIELKRGDKIAEILN